MCTAVCCRTKAFYFGRTLDYECSFGEQVTITPRNFPLPMRHEQAVQSHYAIIGMARVDNGYPLYFDAANEKGLAMAGLNFVGNAVYEKPVDGKHNVASFELIPWILAQCATVRQAVDLVGQMNLTDTAFSKELQPSQLHWMIADKDDAAVLECTKDGLHVYPNPVGVLTNNPPFPQQLFQLNNYMRLSASEPENFFSDSISLHAYSRGMGALGLPGDLSSQSRFVRAAFTKLNAVSGSSENESVSQFFHILGSVEQTRGCCRLGEDQYEITRYSSCCNVDKGIYYYTTYENRQISAVRLQNANLDADALARFPLISEQQVFWQN